MNDKQKHYRDVLDSFNTAMLCTLGDDGVPRSRPMQVADIDDENRLWFFTNLKSEKIAEIEADSTVGITMQGGGKFLSMSGAASIVNDQNKIDDLWKEANRVWFPDGKDSPELTLLVVDPTDGEYWDTSGLKGARYLFEAGKAYFYGTEIEADHLDVNAKVSL